MQLLKKQAKKISYLYFKSRYILIFVLKSKSLHLYLYKLYILFGHISFDYKINFCEFTTLEHKFKNLFSKQKLVLKVLFKDFGYTKINLRLKYIFTCKIYIFFTTFHLCNIFQKYIIDQNYENLFLFFEDLRKQLESKISFFFRFQNQVLI